MKALDTLDWTRIAEALDAHGGTVIHRLLNATDCTVLSGLCELSVVCEESDRTDEPSREASLAPELAPLCAGLYQRLVPIANDWIDATGASGPNGATRRYPDRLVDCQKAGHQAHSLRARATIYRLNEGARIALRQDAEGPLVFPLQVEILLSEPGEDFEGGELVLAERRPRMQSRPMVLPLGRGDAAIFAAGKRPVRGSNGWYRVDTRHAVSRIRRGQRCAVGLLFDDPPLAQNSQVARTPPNTERCGAGS